MVASCRHLGFGVHLELPETSVYKSGMTDAGHSEVSCTFSCTCKRFAWRTFSLGCFPKTSYLVYVMMFSSIALTGLASSTDEISL